MSQGQLPVCGWGVWECGGASNGNREYKRNRFGGILMSSYLDILSSSACGMFRRGSSGGSWKQAEALGSGDWRSESVTREN